MLRIGSLFSGAGGLDMAVEQVFGARTVWHCELDESASMVLAHRWPGVPNLGDVTAVDWSSVEPVEVLCGGFPCQDVSAAGRQAGLRPGTRTGLFLSVIDAIRALRPRIVLLENVLGLLSADGDEWPSEVVALNDEADRWGRIVALINSKKAKAERRGDRDREWWHRKEAEGIRASRRLKVAVAEFRRERLRLVPRAIDTVLRSLAEVGYDAQWHCLRASDVGATHQRERVFILALDANADHAALDGQWSREESRQGNRDAANAPGECGADIAGRSDATGQPVVAVAGAGDRDRAGGAAARSELVGRATGELAAIELLPTPAASRSGNNQSPSPGAAVRPSLDSITALLPTPGAADGSGGRSPSQSGGVRPSGAKRSVPLTDLPLLLPTPTSRDHKGANQRGDETCLHGALLPTPAAADSERGPDFARAGRGGSGGDDLVTATREIGTQWGKYEPAILRWEAVTRPAPSPTEPNAKGNPRLSAAFPEWMMGWPAGWVTALVALGLISRNDALRIIGNGVCPQQAVAALVWLLRVQAVAA